MFWHRWIERRKRNPRVPKTPCPPHVWGDGPDLDHRACVKCGKVIKPVWVEPYYAPPIPEDDVRVINNGGGIEHIPTGVRVLNGEHPHFNQRREAMWDELARRVETHIKSQTAPQCTAP